ncbi:MAG: serine/threonine-protein kinase [Rhodothermales bacterium]|nr:serine/threonine-protein kinase [Rhodothermales bacterium]
MGPTDFLTDVKPFLELSRSAWTVVYKAYQASLDRFVLLKVINPDARHDEDLTARFEEEARLMARIQHPNVVSVYGFGRSPNGAYFTAEYIEGMSLAALLSDHRLPPALALYILSAVVAGLEAAHAEGIFHRDLKPANILLSHEGQVKIADFGMASLDQGGVGKSEIRGTLAYMAPEYLMDPVPTAASDLFSLGATFFEMLAGQSAFAGRDASGVIDAVLQYDPVRVLEANPYVPDGMKAMCGRLLAKSPENRYASAHELAGDLLDLKSAVHPAGAADLKAFLEQPEEVAARLNTPLVVAAARVPTRRPAAATIERGVARAPRRLVYAAWLGVALFLVTATLWAVRNDEPVAEPPVAAALSPVEDSTAIFPDGDTVVSLGAALPEPLVVLQRPARGDAETDVRLPDTDSDSVGVTGLDLTTAPADTTEASSVLPPSPSLAKLSIFCTPYCEAIIENDSLGTVPPVRTIERPAGAYRIRLSHPSFPPYDATVTLAPGQTDTMNVSLWRLVGTLELDVIPWAKVYINGNYVDDTPLETPIVLWPGEHRLMLELPDVGRWETSLSVAAGDVLKRAYKMQDLLGQ